jgi:multidrug efflux system membrane fusion protein
MRRKYPIPFVAAVVCLSGCAKQEDGRDRSRPAMDAPVPVKVAAAVRRDMPVQIRAIARVEAYATVTVKPQIAGQLVAVHFTEGQDVKAGDLLFDIDPQPFQVALRQAEAMLAKDIAMAQDAEAEAKWRAELLQQDAGTQREAETSRATAESLKAAVEADRAAVANARINLEYCSIRAPIDGPTGVLLADRGNVVKANEAALVVINQVQPIYVTFSVPEHYLARIKQYQAAGPLPVAVNIPQDDGPAERGTLSFVDNKVDDTTGMITLKATFANQTRRLWPGQFVNAVLTLTTQPDAVVVPAAAVQTGQTGPFVFVVNDDLRVESRPVVTGLTLDDQAVIERGINAGERVVTDGQLRLAPGAKVDVKGGSATTQETHS